MELSTRVKKRNYSISVQCLTNISGLSDISGVTQKPVTKNLKDGIMTIKKQASDLKGDLRQIRRMHQLSKESLQESIHETMKKIAVSIDA